MPDQTQLVQRPKYILELIKFKDETDLIKVITGAKGVGKTSLLYLYIDYLKSQGVTDDQIAAFYLKEMPEEACDADTVITGVLSKLSADNKNYVLIDDLQRVSDADKLLGALIDAGNADIIVTLPEGYSGRVIGGVDTNAYHFIEMTPLTMYFNLLGELDGVSGNYTH